MHLHSVSRLAVAPFVDEYVVVKTWRDTVDRQERLMDIAANNRLAQFPSPYALVALAIVLDGNSPVAMVLPRFQSSLSDWLSSPFRN